MHTDRYSVSQLAAANVTNWFGLTDAELNGLVTVLIDASPVRPRIRTGAETNAPPKYIKGVPAATIRCELAKLAEETKSILAEGTQDSLLRAVAFYHLRYEGIHALTDGNGRTGRFIMAQQFLKGGWPGNVESFLDGIADNAPFYRMVFLGQIPDEQRYELLLDLLVRVVGYSGELPRIELPGPIAPDNTERVGRKFRFVPLPVSAESRGLIEAEFQRIASI